MKPCLSEVMTLRGSFAEDIANAAAAGCPAVEVWLTKLEQHLQTVSAQKTAKLLEETSVALAAAAYQGGLLLPQGDRADGFSTETCDAHIRDSASSIADRDAEWQASRPGHVLAAFQMRYWSG